MWVTSLVSIICLQEPVRKKHHLKPFEVPRRIQKGLPFDYKPKVRGAWEDPVLSKRVAVVRDTNEKKRDQLLSRLRAIKTAKDMKTREDKIRKTREFRCVRITLRGVYDR